jgi:tetratricopeptide (TPR) repeat protein
LRISLLQLFLIFISITVNAQQNLNGLFSSENRLKFGNQLYKEKDYLRAIDEYKAVLQSNNNDTIRFRFANSFFKIGRFEEAAENFKSLFIESNLSEEAKYLFYQSNFLTNNYSGFRSLYQSKMYFPEKYSRNIDQLNSSTYFFDKPSFFPNENLLLKPFDDSVQTRLAHFYQEKKRSTLKSSTTAALLSVIIPGAGKVYTGELTDGLIAFGATALSAFLAVNNFQNDHQFRGWLFTGLTAFFYGGSIYGSASSAQIYNARFQMNLDKEIKFFFEQRNYFQPNIDY